MGSTGEEKIVDGERVRHNYVVDGRLLGVVVLSGLQAAWVASAGNLDGFAIMSVVLLKFRSELNTTREIGNIATVVDLIIL